MTAWPESLIATHSGLRGRPAVDLTVEVVSDATRRFVALLHERGLPPCLAVATDDRAGGRALAETVIAAAAGAGVNVVDLGAVSTPTAKHAARRRGVGGAVVVTGSHLGPEWNGLKLVAAPTYGPVDVRQLPPGSREPPAAVGHVERDESASAEHAAAVAAAVDAELIRAASLKVSWSGGVGETARVVLDTLGCEVVPAHADAGLRLDADGDRLSLCDESGTELDSEAVLALAAVARRPVHVVKGADTSRMVDDLVADWGGTVETVAPGELHLVEALVRSGGDLAGEGNGGVIVPAVGLARDALAAAATVLELVARTGRPLSKLAAELPTYARRRSTLACASEAEARSALTALADALRTRAPGDPYDGVAVATGDGAWGLVRGSATEPILRITVEARTAARAEELHAELRGALEGSP